MCEFYAFAQIVICDCFECISECTNILFWTFFVFVLLAFMHDLLQNECCSFFACFISAFYIVWAHACCVIFCECICMFFCILDMHAYLPACLIFPNAFLLWILVFFWQIALTCHVLFLQDFVDDMCDCKAFVCCHNLLLSAVWACYMY